MMHARDDVSWGLALQVAGLPVEYYSHALPVLSRVDRAGWLYYTRVPALAAASDLRQSIDSRGGIARAGAVTLTLVSRPELYGADDPVRVFGRLGYGAAGKQAQLVEAVSADVAATTLMVDRNVSTWGYPRLLHVDGETVWATAATDAAQSEITVVRRVAGTPLQAHGPDASFAGASTRPDVTTEVVAWPGRRVLLWAHALDASGVRLDSATARIEILRGFLVETPRIEQGGLSVTLAVAPLTSWESVRLPPGRETVAGLAHGWHFFGSGTFGDTAAQWIEMATLIPDGAVRGQVNAAALGADVIEGANADLRQQHEANADNTKPLSHPQRLPLHGFALGNVPVDIGPVKSYPAATSVELQSVLPRPVRGGSHVSSRESGLAVRQRITGGGLEQWPGPALVEAAVMGDALPWITVRVQANRGGAGGGSLTYFRGGKSSGIYTWVMWRLGATRNIQGEFHFGNDFVSTPVQYWEFGDQPRGLVAAWELAHFALGLDYPLDAVPASPDQDSDFRHRSTKGGLVYPDLENGRFDIRGPALGWYGYNERQILATGPITVPPGETAAVDVTYTDVEGERRTSRVEVVSSTPQVDGAATVGHRWALAPDSWDVLPSFGDWPDSQPVELRRIIAFGGVAPSTLILRLLLSSGGQRATDIEYDVLPEGAALLGRPPGGGDEGVEVDIRSFERLTPPPGLERWTLVVGPDDTLGEVLEDILLSCGWAIVVRRDGAGRCRLTCVDMGLEVATSVDATIDAGDFAADSMPQSSSDDAVTNRLLVEADFDDEGKPLLEARVTDERSARTYGPSREEVLRLRGLRLPSVPFVNPLRLLLAGLYARIFALHGTPRRTWRVQVARGRGLLADVGSTVRVTSSHLADDRGRVGVTAAVARVVEARLPLWPGSATAELELVYRGRVGTGFNAALRVETVTSATVVVVEANAFAPAVDFRGLPQLDVDAVTVGSVWRRHAPHDDDGGTAARTVTAVDVVTRSVTFSGAHGASVGDIFEPETLTTVADDNLRAHAYLADADGLLDAGAADGQDIA